MRHLARIMTVLACIPAAAWARGSISYGTPQVETLLNSGPTASKIDFVFVGEGYTAAELGKFASDVDACVAHLWTIPPFSTRQSDFNIYRVNVISAQSGADHPPTTYVDTAFDIMYKDNGAIGFQSTWNATNLDAARAVAPANDLVLILVNDPVFGGKAKLNNSNIPVWGPARCYNGSLMLQTFPHEMFGHSLSSLDEEYITGISTYTGGEPMNANITIATTIGSCKWAAFAGTDPVTGATVGLFAGGAGTYSSGLNHPVDKECLMNGANQNRNNFCAVCRDRITTAMGIVLGSSSANNAPGTPSTPSGTASGSAGASMTYSTSATDTDLDTIQYTFDWGDGSTSTTSALASGATASASHAWASAGNFSVRAQAQDSKGAASAWSASLSVTISAGSNSAPGTPATPTGPLTVAAGAIATYADSATDPNGNSVRLTFDWGDGTTTLTGYVPSGTVVSEDHAWSVAGAYSVTVTAQDTGAATSSASTPATVTVTPAPAGGSGGDAGGGAAKSGCGGSAALAAGAPPVTAAAAAILLLLLAASLIRKS